MANYIQPDFRIPAGAGVSVLIEKAELNLDPGPIPPPHFIDPVTSKDDPQGTVVAGKSGKGGPG